ncbi:hypothetical protein [Candidatus Oscillochloris fontis]|uniref:hypothetical protein n=1 Tax=Candidatus Oscillochloris fontis TaxID=2496868 RepID=UPI00101BCCFC|nr:hypothetical protein [Candidatus Oscillochloris fontis]
MQLRLYFLLLRRFWMLILLLPLLTGAVSLASGLDRPKQVQATMRLMVVRTLVDRNHTASLPDFNENYVWLTTEYILDDMPMVVASDAFADDIQAALVATGLDLPVGVLRKRLHAEVLHRSVYVTMVADTPEQATQTLQSAVEVLRSKGLSYWGRSDGGLQVVLLDTPQITATMGGKRTALVDAILRAVLALAVAVGLALLMTYLDDRLHTPDQAEAWTGARLLAILPKE